MTSTFSERAWFAYSQRKARERDYTQEVLAERVGAATRETWTQSAAQRWLSGTQPEELKVQIAFAQELGVDPGWLYYGIASAAPAPVGWEEPPAEQTNGRAQPEKRQQGLADALKRRRRKEG